MQNAKLQSQTTAGRRFRNQNRRLHSQDSLRLSQSEQLCDEQQHRDCQIWIGKVNSVFVRLKPVLKYKQLALKVRLYEL